MTTEDGDVSLVAVHLPRVLSTVLVAIGVLGAATSAFAQREPAGAHPRLLLDDALQKSWARAAKEPSSPVARAVQRCAQIAAAPAEFSRDGYMGLDWCHHLQACLIAHAATGEDRYAATAIRYFTALLDDLQHIGDGKGGDQAARRDSGYAIRAMGPYTALAYDWLHDHKLMTEELRRRARQRFAAWTTWYVDNGYRARSPATNYQAGYLMAATLIAVAQGGEAGPAGAKLWRHVVDDLWRKDMTKAFAPGGVLDGGDWAEGWQYGPLSVAEYAVTLRVMRRMGVELEAARSWPVQLLQRHVHALAPSDRLFVGGDTQTEEAYIEPYMFTMAAVALSDAAPPQVRAHAVAEMDRLNLASRDFWLFDALARGTGIAPQPVPRAQWPTWYLAKGTSTLHARTRWDAAAVWMVVQCSRTLDVDHFQPNAGNFVISRGVDNLIVDPSPYGSLSTLTGNAPTVDSPQLPENYRPSQAYWSEDTGLRWAHQTERGVVVARCDYADQYKFQSRPSDTPMALRDFALIPSRDGASATLVMADRVDTSAAGRSLYLQFRALAPWALDGDHARTEVGGSAAVLTTFAPGKARPSVSAPTQRNCFGEGVERGKCDAARFPVSDLRWRLPGPKVTVLHALEVGARGLKPRSRAVRGAGYDGVARDAAAGAGGDGGFAVLWADAAELRYPTKAGVTAVVYGAPADAQVSGRAADGGCELVVRGRGGRSVETAPLVLRLDDACQPSADAIAPGATAATAALAAAAPSSAAATRAPDAPGARDDVPDDAGPGAAPAAAEPPSGAPRSPRSGCCGASTTSGASLPMALLVAAALLLRRRRRARG